MVEKKEAWTKPVCASCLLTIALDMIRRSTDDPNTQFNLVRGTHALLEKISKEALTVELANEIFDLIMRETATEDPFLKEKIRSNEMGARAAKMIQDSHSGEKNESNLRDAVIASIVGNIIDFGTADHEVVLEPKSLFETYQKIREQGLDVDNTPQLFQLIKDGGKHILYNLDNAGELAFDKILIALLVSFGNEVCVVVKDKPYSNDCMLDDARQLQLEQIPKTHVIATSRFCLGFTHDDTSPEFSDALKEADLIISKGQNNFETFTYYWDRKGISVPILYILRVKCEPLAQFWGVSVGANICSFRKIRI